MPSTATTVLNSSRAYLNDTAIDLYTDAVLLPYLKLANKELQDKCLVYGIEIVRVVDDVIEVDEDDTVLTLPADFLLPVALWERDRDGGDEDWVLMKEQMWEPSTIIPTTTLNFWSFRNENIYFIGATQDKDVKLQYERSLAALAAGGDTIDTDKFYRFLAAVTAEKAARYIGNNIMKANEIKNEESIPAGWDLAQYLTLNQQGIRQRRQQFTTKRSQHVRSA